jgi:predicted Fe-S protein YdhL (DUF1289 family)
MSENKKLPRWPEIETPCIGYCSTTLGDEICKGCGRTSMEVDAWIFMNDSQKAAVWDRIEAAQVGFRWRG